MKTTDSLVDPAREFGVLPFWFWNDELDEADILRQIADFQQHGVDGFVIHPRVGLPRDLGGISARRLHFYRIAIDEARRRGMQVVLYDEDLHPLGSAAGQVVAGNPAYACRGIAMQPLADGASPALADGENLVAVVARQGGERIAVIDRPVRSVARELLDVGDGPAEESAPAADLLNPLAAATFIELVHERFAAAFGEAFGDTIRAIFTDESAPLARCPEHGVMRGTTGVLPVVGKSLGYDFTPHLPALWFDDEPDVGRHRAAWQRAIDMRLRKTYYLPVAKWCKRHDIALTGHPRRPDDLGTPHHFQIPDQDLVWRRVLRDLPGTLEERGSTQAKCTASTMAHLDARRKVWLAAWAFVRGVNLRHPHAFYYSTRGARRDEWRPDAGSHAAWWPGFPQYAMACRRLAWINTDSRPLCEVAILVVDDAAPCAAATACFERQHDFVYLDEQDVVERALIDASSIRLGDGAYRVLVVEGELSQRATKALAPFAENVVRFDPASPGDLSRAIERRLGLREARFAAGPGLRVRRAIKRNVRHTVLFNEACTPIDAAGGLDGCVAPLGADVFRFDPFDGRRWLWPVEASPRDDASMRRLVLGGHRVEVALSLEDAPFEPPFERAVRWEIPLVLEVATSPFIFTSCDSGYLDYALSLVRSAEAFSPGCAFLLHLVNPADEDIERVRETARGLSATTLALSAERVDLSALDGEQRRTYFACARFLRLAELLPLLDAPVLCLDADSLVVGPIDHHFTDKPNAEICLVRRDQGEPIAPQLAVGNGTIWLKPTTGVLALLGAVARDIAHAFADGSAAWYLDQLVMGRHVAAARGLGVFNIKRKYADWDFREDSIIWAGKGARKHSAPVFTLLQRALVDDPQRRQHALRLAGELFPRDGATGRMPDRFAMLRARGPSRVALFMPRLDLPWKRPAQPDAAPPSITEDTLSLRLHWKEFAIRLANALERKGATVDIVELPAWHIDAARVDASGAHVALVAHRCRLDFEPGATPVRYYMQEFFRWAFVVDRDGWSAASSAYPMDPASMRERGASGPFDAYRRGLVDGRLASKFAQSARMSRDDLVASGQIPAAPYVFFPLQIPHDQSIRYFSDCSQREVVEALLAWSRSAGVALVLKPHPVNPKSMREFEALARAAGVHWSEAHVHDLIGNASAVYTMNSGVGFEALLHLKPVVAFARVEYDCVAHRADRHALDAAWAWARAATPASLEPGYRRFVDWFLDDYAVDMSRPSSAVSRLDAIAAEIIAAADARRASLETAGP
jgi:hypothetical protein